MKKVLMYSALAAVMLLAFSVAPASAQSVVKESSCTDAVGSNSVTYDCGFVVKNYQPGQPVTLRMNYVCATGKCGPMLSFGLRNNGFSPSGVSGQLIGGRFLGDGVELVFQFDQLKSAGKGYTGNAHFFMNLFMDDGSGTMVVAPCNFDVHLDGKQ